MSLKKYYVTKDIYHKGKLLKAGSIVASETNHKYFEPYIKDEFSNEKEPATIIVKDQPDSAVKYDENGVVIKAGEKKPSAPKPAKPENSNPKTQQAAKGKSKAAALAEDEDEESKDEQPEGDDAF